jgi:hypothetical protein
MTTTLTLVKMAKLVACFCILSTLGLFGEYLTYGGKYVSNVGTRSPDTGAHILLTDCLQEATDFTVKDVPVKRPKGMVGGYAQHHILFNNQFLAWVKGTLQLRSTQNKTTIWRSCPTCGPSAWGKYWNMASPSHGVDKTTDCELVVVKGV